MYALHMQTHINSIQVATIIDISVLDKYMGVASIAFVPVLYNVYTSCVVSILMACHQHSYLSGCCKPSPRCGEVPGLTGIGRSITIMVYNLYVYTTLAHCVGVEHYFWPVLSRLTLNGHGKKINGD